MSISQQSIAIIRQRGQLTIPDSVRKATGWIFPNAVVSITVKNKTELCVKPLSPKESEEKYWKDLWRDMERIRSFKGKRGNLSKFIAEDRYRH